MKLEHQVSSLALSQKLKELGVKQESLHSWCYIEAHGDYELDNGDCSRMYSALTVAELGEMLPNWIGHPTDLPFKSLGKKTITPWAWIVKGFYGSEKTEADARASMLIYLIENNLIKL